MERLTINSYSGHLKKLHGERVQKITMDAGFTCPNRDGAKGVGGCTYCNNDTFAPPKLVSALSIKEQIDHGIKISKRKYKNVKKFYAYFQAYSNTYAPLEKLKELYSQALEHPEVIGLCIGTRPDCVDEQKLDYLEQLAKDYDVTLEYGLESISDETLLKINRCHDYQCFVDTVNNTKNRGIKICTHIILGFPWENRAHWINTAKELSKLPLDYLKIHQLHVVKYTQMANEYVKNPFKMLSKDEYLDIMTEFLAHLNPKIVIQRLAGSAPLDMLVSPSWGEKISDISTELSALMESKGLYQGIFYPQVDLLGLSAGHFEV